MNKSDREDYTEGREALRYLAEATFVILLVVLGVTAAGALIVRIARWAFGW